MLCFGEQTTNPAGIEKNANKIKKSIKPWFDYSDPYKIGVRKRIVSITISEIEHKKYSNFSNDGLKNKVTKFSQDLRGFIYKSKEEHPGSFMINPSKEEVEKRAERT